MSVLKTSLFLLLSLMTLSLASCGINTNPIVKGTAMDFMLSSYNENLPINVYLTDVPHSYWQISYAEPEESDTAVLGDYLTLFNKELDKYPDSLFQAARLENAVIIKKLYIQGQKRSGLPDYYRNTLYLDFTSGTYNKTYQRHTIHHEFYHILEQKVNGSAYWKDPAWARLNDSSFSYGNGGASAQSNSNAYTFVHPQPGFVNEYSMSGLEEDKAEVFAALLTPGEYEKVMTWIATDPILAAKVDYMKNFLQQLCPEINEDFWTRLHP